ncbi:MAG: metallophosphoesterase [Phaeodactylibacter sp.]|nr:metallophosphoesterase [Phaeodactylibacter sp.]MCB9052184.1 metallophosphoesterase [Lewinellaceae bacterium]
MKKKVHSFSILWGMMIQRMRRKSSWALLLLMALGLPLTNALAHGSLHEAIERKNRQIEAQPDDVLLRFERGMLYQEHGDIGLALKDFHTVLQMEPAYLACHLPLAQLYRDTNEFQKALFHINSFLEQEPDNPFGYGTRASIYQKSGAYLQALADLRQMATLKNDNAIRPDDYFLLADGILLAYPGDYRQAIAALEKGIQRLGDIISLQSRLVDLEMANQDYPAAIRRIEHIMQPLPRKDKWLQKKAEAIRLMQQQKRALPPPSPGRPDGKQPGGPNASGYPFAVSPGGYDAPVAESLVSVIRGPYLQSGTPTSMIIRWRTNTATSSKVWYGANPDNLTQTMVQSGSRTNHEIKLSALQPNTRYYYAIGDANGVLAGGTADHFFKTSPPPGTVQPVRAWVLGDCGTADNNARDVRDGYYSYVGDNFTDLILLLGDNAYDNGKDSEYQKAIFENMYEDKLIQSVMWSTPGNHDFHSASAADQSGPYFDIFTFPKNGEAGGLASGTEAYYSFDFANIHFVVLDSHDSGRAPGDPMLVWLENDLNASQQDWLVVFFHHPPYSKGSHDSDQDNELIDMRENVLPILEAAGVDLVLSGHSHSYERSYLLNGHYGPSNSVQPSMVLDNGDGRIDGDGAYQKEAFGAAAGKGAVYTCAGSSGKVSNAPLDHPVMFYNALTLGSLSLEVTGTRLDLKFIGVNGEVLDYFTIRKFIPVGSPPTVEVTSPADGAFFYSIQPITLRAQASDSDGSIEEVAFFVNGDSIGVDHSAPYKLTWTPPSEGNFYIKAKAKDNNGNAVTSVEQAFYVGFIQACSQVSNREDDAEEDPTGSVTLSSTDLEMINEPNDGDQWVGMRFSGLDIPANAIISKAWIQFTVEDNNNVNPCQLAFYGEASNNPAPFAGTNFNVSNRPLTQASVNWQPPDWQQVGDMGPAQQTPNLAPILQELLRLPGYSPSNPMALIVQGQGRRTAQSHEGQPFWAPRLCVEYLFCQPATLPVTSSANNICPGQPITLSAGPADSYLWSTGATTAQINVQPSQTATYSLTAWDGNGCPATGEATVNVLPPPQLSLEPGSISFCPGQGVEVTAPAGFTQYQWSNGQTTPTVLANSPGAWSLTVTNAAGCTASDSFVATEYPPLNLQISSSDDGICIGESVTLSATSAASYLWANGATTPQLAVTPDQTTAFSLTAWDENGCSETAEFTVEVFPEPEISFEPDTVFFCSGQGVKISSPGGFAGYQWSGGQVTPTVFIQSPGAWSLTVTDANGCTASAGLEAIQIPPLNLQATSSANEICAGQMATLTASPAPNYLWSTGATTPEIVVHPTTTTSFVVEAWGTHGCAETAEITIQVLDSPVFELVEMDGLIAVTGLGDPGPYSYQWSTGDDSAAISPDAPGLYCVTVTNSQDCAREDCYEFLSTGTAGLSAAQGWEVFPNPFRDEIHLRSLKASDKVQALVFGLLGQPVPFRMRQEENETILEFRNLPAGFYTIVISDGKDTAAMKMLKQ